MGYLSSNLKNEKMTKKIVIIGCGFGGIALGKKLIDQPFDVLLLDKNNYHTFQPLLYQVATGGLEADSIAYPIRRVFRGAKNVRFQMCEVLEIEPVQKILKTNVGNIDYDILVVASGSCNKYFNFESIKYEFLPLKSVTDALNMRSFLMQNLEQTVFTYNADEKESLMNIAIIGGGATGIELAGALAEMRRYVLPKDFPEIDFANMKITLFEAAPKLLGSMSAKASKASERFLKKLGVEIKLNAKVVSYEQRKITLDDGHTFLADSVIWTAGVKGNAIDGLKLEYVNSENRFLVDEYNKVLNLDNVYAIGDVAAFTGTERSKGLPMLAPVAMQQATLLAKNLIAIENGKPLVPFVYKNKGVMATIGKNKAVVDLPSYSFQGVFAWFVWMFVHIISLVGYRNKLVTLLDWTGNYFNYDRPLGLIIRPYKKRDSVQSKSL